MADQLYSVEDLPVTPLALANGTVDITGISRRSTISNNMEAAEKASDGSGSRGGGSEGRGMVGSP